VIEFKSQREMFEWIWERRPPFSELSGDPLFYPGHPKWHWQFLHVLPKGSYPKFKLNPGNILLGTPEEHDRQEEFDIFRRKKMELTREYYEMFYDKKF